MTQAELDRIAATLDRLAPIGRPTIVARSFPKRHVSICAAAYDRFRAMARTAMVPTTTFVERAIVTALDAAEGRRR